MDIQLKSIRRNIKSRLRIIRKESKQGKIFAKNIRVFYSWNLIKMRWDNFVEFRVNESSYLIKEKHNIWIFVHTEKNTEHEKLIFTDKTEALEYFESIINGILNYHY